MLRINLKGKMYVSALVLKDSVANDLPQRHLLRPSLNILVCTLHIRRHKRKKIYLKSTYDQSRDMDIIQ